jgi:hypothetical protein
MIVRMAVVRRRSAKSNVTPLVNSPVVPCAATVRGSRTASVALKFASEMCEPQVVFVGCEQPSDLRD